MKKLLLNALILSVSASLLTSCSSNTQSQNTGLGAVGGAVVGGVAGSALVGGAGAVAVGAVAGALLGGFIGHSMDSSDTSAVNTTMESNATNMPAHWTNPKTGVVYHIVPTSNKMTVDGNPNCRTYRAIATMNGKKHVSYGTLCRQSDGAWHEVKK